MNRINIASARLIKSTLGRAARAGLLMMLALGLMACSVLPAADGDGAAAVPILQALSSPSDTVRSFIEAWGRRDYPAMYGLLSTESQGLTTLPVFEATYVDADEKIGTTAASFTIVSTQTQGMTAAVSYDLLIESSVFGSIEDAGRVMRLVQAPNGWRIAWSTMDIFDGYAPGTGLTVESRRLPRANIFDRGGQLLVEQNGMTIGLFVSRQELSFEDDCLDSLANVLRRDRAELVELFASFNPETIFAVGDVDPEVFAAREAELTANCAIRSQPRQTRRYVGHGIASHAIGYVGQISAEQLDDYRSRGYTQGDLVGQIGVELAYEEQLAGEADRVLRIVEPGGLLVRELAGTPGRAPQPVTLTLDVGLQTAAAQAFADAYNTAAPNWGGRSPGGGAVVIDIDTGAILALASWPTFDPGIFVPDTPIIQVGQYIASLGTDDRQPFFNRATQGQYAPGSTFKIITLAAAAAERLMRPDEIFTCNMEWDGRPFGDTLERRLDWRASEPEEFRFNTGDVTMAHALTASCNPFFYQMGAQLFRDRGATVLTDYARRMGFGSATGLSPLLPEASGRIVPPNNVEEAISTAVGQYETQVTIVQMARMVAGIANGGTLYRPYLVQQVGGEDGEPSFTAEPEVVGEMGLSDEVLDVIREGMCAVTTQQVVGASTGKPLGTAWFVFDDPEGTGVAPYTVCAKTGTAQTGRPEPHAWFVAYAPADDPQIAIAVMTENSREGSETSAPIVRRILDYYFGVEPAPFPSWWTGEYVALTIPEGSTGG